MCINLRGVALGCIKSALRAFFQNTKKKSLNLTAVRVSLGSRGHGEKAIGKDNAWTHKFYFKSQIENHK
jgi:hypothetical protein